MRAARDTAHTAHAVTAIRAGDRAASSRPAAPAESLSPSGSMAALREAIEAGESVLIGYVDNQGTTSERLVDPVRVEGGSLTAHDHRSDDLQHVRRPPDHDRASGHRLIRTIESWTFSGTPRPRPPC